MAKKEMRIPPIEELSETSQALYDAINDARDSVCVILAAAFLDQCLASILKQFFIDGKTSTNVLDSTDGVLQSFAARADVAYCLGLIPSGLCQNLRLVAEIRNRFAHSHLELTFDDPEIQKKCNALTFMRVAVGKRVDCDSGTVVDTTGLPIALTDPPRVRFRVCVALMAQKLIATGHTVEKRKKEETGWN